MNYFKRAWLSVVRRKGKSLILLIVIFILGNVIAGAFSIQQASKNVEKNIKMQLGATATVELDWERLDEEYQKDPNFMFEGKPVGMDLIEEIAQNQHVRYFDYSLHASLRSTTLKQVTMEDMEIGEDPLGAYFDVQGVQYPAVTDIAEGKLELTSGRVFTDEDIASGKLVTLVSEEFAKTNGVTVGDVVTLKNIVTTWDQETQKEAVLAERDVSLEIIGLFKPLIRETKDGDKPQVRSDQDWQRDWQTNQLHNKLYVPNKVAYEESYFNAEQMQKTSPEYFPEGMTIDELIMQGISPIFAIENPESLEAFRSEVDAILPDFYKVTTSSDAYDAISGPIASLDNMSRITLAVAIGATILILSLVIVLFLRDRKHELGIYLSLGDRRSGVLTQIVSEVVMVAIVGLTLSLVTGNIIASGLSNNLMNNAAGPDNGFVTYSMGGYNLPSADITEDDVKDAYKVELTPQYIGLFYLIGLGVTIGSTIIPIVYITRLNPKKIMM